MNNKFLESSWSGGKVFILKDLIISVGEQRNPQGGLKRTEIYLQNGVCILVGEDAKTIMGKINE